MLFFSHILKRKKLSHFYVSTALFLFVFVFLMLEPIVKDSLVFALNYFDSSKISTQDVDTDHMIIQNIEPRAQQKSHAPESSTIVLIITGITGMLVRFVRKSFEEFKRAFDVAVSLIGFVALVPLFAIVAVLIKLSSRGPIIYKQVRVGKNGKRFMIYKFRSMRRDAEKSTGAVWAKENDPRITFIGKMLRKTHLDEMPQLFNVLKGDMSIVGPRPERPEIIKKLKLSIPDYEKRLAIKPGITGLAQVKHRYDETMADVKKKVKLDLLYIRKMCLLTDTRIIASTFIVVLTGKGAR